MVAAIAKVLEKFFFTACFVLIHAEANSQQIAPDSCSLQNLGASTPSSDFQSIEDGSIVIHATTGLEWRRCVVGAIWNEGSCDGQPRSFDWQAALQYADTEAGWRLPNIQELRSVVEYCRIRPSVNVNVFPNAPSVPYWTSTPFYADLPGDPSDGGGLAWIVDFSSGIDGPLTKEGQALPILLVRD